MLKQLLVNSLSRAYKEHQQRPIYLQFSAGCDSAALFFAMLELRHTHPFECITYYYAQNKAFIKRIEGITKQYDVPLKVTTLTTERVMSNASYLHTLGYKGKVLVDCLSGLLSLVQLYPQTLMVNGGGGDTLYGSLRYIFGYGYIEKGIFDAIRRNQLARKDPSGLDSLRELLAKQGSALVAPFKDPEVIEYFMTKDYYECGGDKKTLFKTEFAEDIARTPFAIFRMSQQIESGIRDLLKNPPTPFFG